MSLQLLSNAARKQCVANLKQLPNYLENMTKENLRIASVLIPLCVHNGEVCLLYTLRSFQLLSHSGQVSFPGGKADPDENEVDTALRETEEEIGFNRDQIDVWGSLPQVLNRSGDMLIKPIVGELKNFDFNSLKANTNEVEEIFTVSMIRLCDTNYHGSFNWKGVKLPVFLHEKHNIWGITGFITNTFLQCFVPNFKFDYKRKDYKLDDLLPSKSSKL